MTSPGTVTEEERRMEARMKTGIDGQRLWLLISIITGRLHVPFGRFLDNTDDKMMQIDSWTRRVEYHGVGD